jgi:hypothetical protein
LDPGVRDLIDASEALAQPAFRAPGGLR